MGGEDSLTVLTSFTGVLGSAARLATSNEALEQSGPAQSSSTPSYREGWEDLPDWLKPSHTNPDDSFQWFGHAAWLRILATGAHIQGLSAASALLNHYLMASGAPYFISAQDVLGNAEFMRTINRLIAGGGDGAFNAVLALLSGHPVSAFPITTLLALNWSVQPRFDGDMQPALGTSTVNAVSPAQVAYTLVPDPNNPQSGMIRITVRQDAELYDRYDWGGYPIAYNKSSDTVAIPGNPTTGRPVLVLDKNGTIVDTYPLGTDLRTLPGFTHIPYPPDSPDLGAADRLWSGEPASSAQVFGTLDHPYGSYAGDFHSVEANGAAKPFDVYSRWTYEQTLTAPYQIVNGNVVVAGGLTSVGDPVHTPSNIPVSSGRYTPVHVPPPPLNPNH